MGSCFSLSAMDISPPSAKVVSINGALRLYTVPINVSSVLEAEAASSSSSSFTSSFFLCNSDFLTYDDPIPELDSKALLYPNQLYFVLPRSKLQNRLSASDMAALAVKASAAIQRELNKTSRRSKKARISPAVAQPEENNNAEDHVAVKSFPAKKEAGISRSGSMRRLQKYTSRRAKLAVRSFRLRLSTIHEGTVLSSSVN